MKCAARWWVVVLILGQGACGDPLTPGWLVDKPRVLGARVEAKGEPARATVNAGETARVTWLVGFPDAAKPTAWSFVACPEAGTLRGVPACESAPFALAQGSSAATEEPTFEITLPDLASFGSASEVLVAGQICTEPGAFFDWKSMTGSCAGAEVGTTVDLRVTLGSAATENANPPFPESGLTLDAAQWSPIDPALDACASSGVANVAPGSVHAIGVTVPAEAREPDGSGLREVIQLSHFATTGTLPGQFSFVEADDLRSEARIDVAWNAPPEAEPPASERVARFYFVMRDLRGGASWVSRTACVR